MSFVVSISKVEYREDEGSPNFHHYFNVQVHSKNKLISDVWRRKSEFKLLEKEVRADATWQRELLDN